MGILIKGALAVLPGDEVRAADIYVEGDSIASIDKAPEGFVSERVIDGGGRLLTPGFVNAHTHIYMTALRNRADDLNFMTWLFDRVVPMEDKLTDEDAYWSIQLGVMEMLLSGATSLLDMHMFPLTTAKALKDAGFRAVISRGLQGSDEDPEPGRKRLAQAEEEIAAYKDCPTLGFMLAPHAPYTCDEGYLRNIVQRASELGVGLHTHLSESQDEQDKAMAKYGCTPAQLYDRCGVLTDKTVCAHCVKLSESEMELFAERGVSVAHNPASNMKLGNGFAPVEKMLEKGVNVAIGTDGCCSNNNQNMLREMSLAALIHKGTAKEATAVTAKQVFDMATVNGAKALGLGGVTGEIKAGMKADLSLFNLDYPGFYPLGEPKAALCYASAGLRAETVLVNGRVLLDRGEFTTIDTDKVKYHVNALTERLGRI